MRLLVAARPRPPRAHTQCLPAPFPNCFSPRAPAHGCLPAAHTVPGVPAHGDPQRHVPLARAPAQANRRPASQVRRIVHRHEWHDTARRKREHRTLASHARSTECPERIRAQPHPRITFKHIHASHQTTSTLGAQKHTSETHTSETHTRSAETPPKLTPRKHTPGARKHTPRKLTPGARKHTSRKLTPLWCNNGVK